MPRSAVDGILDLVGHLIHLLLDLALDLVHLAICLQVVVVGQIACAQAHEDRPTRHAPRPNHRRLVGAEGLARYDIHRTTIIHHLDQAGIVRRRVVRKITNESVALAAERYEEGASLAVVASEFGVHQRTLARELRRAGAYLQEANETYEVRLISTV